LIGSLGVLAEVTIVTGAAGFIGFHLSRALLDRGERVVGIDNMNPYYDVRLKEARLKQLADRPGFTFAKLDIADRAAVFDLFDRTADARHIVHLAAQAGVRHSLRDPYVYVESNVMGQVVMLEAARRLPNLENFVYASSSSVYGANDSLPFSTADRVDAPVSLYAATKRSGELIAHCYAHLYGIPCVGLRFFTVYGPWGRPDMAAYLFAQAIEDGRPIRLFNNGEMRRDFTYIDDVISGIIAARGVDVQPDATGVRAALYNLGNHRSEKLLDYVALIEREMGRAAEKVFEPMQDGDVAATYADIERSMQDLGFAPTTPISVGIPKFIAWFKDYNARN
jgi:UDP-glucuronate 4-epimerase